VEGISETPAVGVGAHPLRAGFAPGGNSRTKFVEGINRSPRELKKKKQKRPLLKGERSDDTGMNDSPVDCQNRGVTESQRDVGRASAWRGDFGRRGPTPNSRTEFVEEISETPAVGEGNLVQSQTKQA